MKFHKATRKFCGRGDNHLTFLKLIRISPQILTSNDSCNRMRIWTNGRSAKVWEHNREDRLTEKRLQGARPKGRLSNGGGMNWNWV